MFQTDKGRHQLGGLSLQSHNTTLGRLLPAKHFLSKQPWKGNWPWNTELLAVESPASRRCSKGSSGSLQQSLPSFGSTKYARFRMNLPLHTTTGHSLALCYLPGTKQPNGLAHRGLVPPYNGVHGTEPGHTTKWRKAQSPVVSCTAVFTGASSLKTEDILRRVATTFSTSDVSVWKRKIEISSLLDSYTTWVSARAVERITAFSWLTSALPWPYDKAQATNEITLCRSSDASLSINCIICFHKVLWDHWRKDANLGQVITSGN